MDLDLPYDNSITSYSQPKLHLPYVLSHHCSFSFAICRQYPVATQAQCCLTSRLSLSLTNTISSRKAHISTSKNNTKTRLRRNKIATFHSLQTGSPNIRSRLILGEKSPYINHHIYRSKPTSDYPSIHISTKGSQNISLLRLSPLSQRARSL
jgi:hypothetical protein